MARRKAGWTALSHLAASPRRIHLNSTLGFDCNCSFIDFFTELDNVHSFDMDDILAQPLSSKHVYLNIWAIFHLVHLGHCLQLFMGQAVLQKKNRNLFILRLKQKDKRKITFLLSLNQRDLPLSVSVGTQTSGLKRMYCSPAWSWPGLSRPSLSRIFIRRCNKTTT